MKRVLITGSKGFVGKHLVKYLHDNAEWTLELADFNLLKPIPDMGKYDYIIHLASMSSVEESIRQPMLVINNNVIMTVNLLEYARKYPPEKFLLLSSVEAYAPTSPYAASKAAQEVIAESYRHTYDIPVIIAASHNIVGSGQSPEKFVPKVVEMIKSGQTVQIYTQDGEIGQRIYNPVQNITSAILFMLKEDLPLTKFDIGGGRLQDNLWMAQRIARSLGKELKYELIEGTAVRKGYSPLLEGSGSDLGLYGWAPPYNLEAGLEWIK